MSELGRFHDAVARALSGDVAALSPWTAPDAETEARFSVYRNTVAKGLADAVAAQFPTVVRAVGEDWMREAALHFAREHPPASPALLAYGEAFPAWLAGFAPAADMPWLAGLARIDWAVRDALFAPDAEPVDAAAFAALPPEAYAEAVLDLHPSAAALWFADGAPGLWRALQADPPAGEAELAAEPEGLLVMRPALEVVTRPLTAGGFAFVSAARAGATLAAAGAAALEAEPDLPLAELFADLIALGVFVCIRRSAGGV